MSSRGKILVRMVLVVLLVIENRIMADQWPWPGKVREAPQSMLMNHIGIGAGQSGKEGLDRKVAVPEEHHLLAESHVGDQPSGVPNRG